MGTAPAWGRLRLKFQWYAVRLPELRERLLDLYESLFKDDRQEFCRAAVRNRPAQNYTCLTAPTLGGGGGVLSGLIFESHFRPALLSPNRWQRFSRRTVGRIDPHLSQGADPGWGGAFRLQPKPSCNRSIDPNPGVEPQVHLVALPEGGCGFFT
jgi:hypothetical protein